MPGPAARPPSATGIAASGRSWANARGSCTLDVPRIMGIVNLSPDSFWDGGRFCAVDNALPRIDQIIAEGADIIDLGGESTRPGAAPVAAEEEIRRVLPVLHAAVRNWPEAIFSVDTVKAAVARAAIEEGAAIINDVSGLRLDPDLANVVAAAGAGLVLMHSRGGIADMARYELAEYGADPVGDIIAELSDALQRARRAGVPDAAVVLDPGLGFAKRAEHNLGLLRQLDRVAALGRPVLIGPSRKRFLGEALGGAPPEARLEAGITACILALQNGATIFRMHDVGAARRALDFAHATLAPM